MKQESGGGFLIETPAEKAIKEQAQETKDQRDFRKTQTFFNGVLTFATVLTAGVVLYQNWIMSTTAELDQRAWVGVAEIRRITEPELDKRLIFAVRLTNSGRTPALEVATHKELSFSGPSDSSVDPHEKGSRSKMAIAPAGAFLHQGGTIPLTKEMLNAIVNNKQRLFFFGTIHYTDIFGKGRSTTFCAIYVYQQQGDPGLEFCADYNRMK